jgi:serine phosphatase RsbU (regulator of sigma subunit)
LAVADCTGHGTSGAMLSMICSNYLDQAVNDHHLTDPSMIISYVYDKLINFMKRHDNTIISDYGMEISICNINTDSRTVYYAGINRPLILFRSGSLEILNPQKVRVGDGYHSIVVNIKASQQVNLNAGDTLYMLTDGYVDQIGGPDNKKFLSTNLIKTLESIQSKTMLEQFDILNCSIEEWKNQALTSSNEQTDDILVIGVRL